MGCGQDGSRRGALRTEAAACPEILSVEELAKIEEERTSL